MPLKPVQAEMESEEYYYCIKHVSTYMEDLTLILIFNRFLPAHIMKMYERS